MRLADSIEKHGYFWLPSEEENALYGTLEISKKGQITLELMVPVEYPKSIAKKPWPFDQTTTIFRSIKSLVRLKATSSLRCVNVNA